MKTPVDPARCLPFLKVGLFSLIIIASVASRGFSYTLHADPDTLSLSAPIGDTASAMIRIYDGRDPSSRPLRASAYVSGNNNCEIASPHVFYFAGSAYIRVVYMPMGPQSQGSLTVTTDSGSLSITLIGTLGSTSGMEMNQPNGLPIFDSIGINHSSCKNFQITNYASDGPITVTAIRVEPWNQSSVQFSVTGAPTLPYKFGSGNMSFQVCALALDAKDSNFLFGYLHVDYTSNSGSETALWPLYAFVVPPDTSCIAVDDDQINMEAVTEGDTVIRLFRLHNITSSTVTIDSAHFVDGDSDRFAFISPSCPFTIPANSIDSIAIRYNVPSHAASNSYNSTLEFWPVGTSGENLPCGTYVAPVAGQVTILPCLSAGLPYLAPILEGASQTGFDTIFNKTDSAVVLDSIKATSGNTADFSFLFPSFPVTLAAHTNMLLQYQFTVPSPCLQPSLGVYLTASDHGTRPDGMPCTTLSLAAIGQLLIPWDTILLELPASTSDTITVDVHAAISEHALVIQNSTQGKIYLVNVQATDSGNYVRVGNTYGPHCVDISRGLNLFCMDDTLVSGAWSDTMRFMMVVPDSGTYPIDLTVNYSNALLSQKYVICIHYIAPAGAGVRRTLVTQVPDFTLHPNPASGQVTIALPTGTNSTVDIYDILGNLIYSKISSGTFVWNGKASSREVSAGSYIVRVRRPDGNGGYVTGSKRLMLLQ